MVTRPHRSLIPRLAPLAPFLALLLCLGPPPHVSRGWEPDDQADVKDLVNRLRALETDQLGEPASDVLREHLRRLLREANERSTREWREISTRGEWESFRDEKLRQLRESLGQYPTPPKAITAHVTGRQDGPGYVLENLVFETRPGLWVTANRYLPARKDPANSKSPGILICHAHHTPKEHRELQHMGMMWARRGAVVLVMDQVGHGERRQHPFRTADDYGESFRVSRQDYYFRYDNGIQLHLAGQSLIGQIAWDLQRGIDLLLAMPGVDPERIALLGAVAGGGDPAAVTAALDRRIALAVPFNFGGPQPETSFPLPEDADDRFNYAGSGSWESTRNLYRSAQSGFLPWVIVAGVAPRKLVYAHEFSWDRERDPVWRRLQQVYSWYGEADGLDWTHGFGSVRGQAPDASHCTHIGPVQRKRIHAALERWFQLPGADEPEFLQDRPAGELTCWTDEARVKLQPQPLRQVLQQEVDERLSEFRKRFAALPDDDRRVWLADQWQAVLGRVAPDPFFVAGESEPVHLAADGVTQYGVVLQMDSDVRVPLVLLVPPTQGKRKPPVVVAVSQSGKQRLLQARAAEIARLLAEGVAVCLPDLRGLGETRPDDGRQRQSSATSLASSALMVDGPLLGQRMRDLRSVLAYLGQRKEVDADRLALWGDSLSEPNADDAPFQAPRGIERRARQSEPLGGLLALLTPLYEPDVRAVYWHGGLSGYRSVLDSPFVYVPYDVVVPGALLRGDLCDVAAGLAPLPLLASGMVDGWNRPLDQDSLRRVYAPAWNRYKERNASPQLNLVSSGDRPDVATWLVERLK